MSNDGVNTGRRRFLVAATSVVGAAGAVGAAIPFVGSWSPSARARAAGAPVKVNISKIEPGQQMVAEWRGQPVFILRRGPEILDNLGKLTGQLSDPESRASVQQAMSIRRCARSGRISCCWSASARTWDARRPSVLKSPLPTWARTGWAAISVHVTALTTTWLVGYTSLNPRL